VRCLAASGVLLTAVAACTWLAPLDGLSQGANGGADGSVDGTAGDAPASSDSPPGDGGAGGKHDAPADVTSDPVPVGSGGLRRAIAVTANDAVDAGYVVRFLLDTQSLVAAGKALSSLDDVRIVDPLGSERDRVVDSPDASSSTIWFALSRPIAAGASDTYWLEYDHPDAGGAPANGAKVFSFYDDFSGNAPASHWIWLGNPTVSAGTLRLHAWDPDSGADPDSLTTNVQTDGVPAASSLEIVATVTNPASPQDVVNGFWYWLGYQHGDFVADEPWILWISRHTNQVWAEEVIGDASFTGSIVVQDTAPHDYVIDRAPSQTVFYRDDVPDLTATLANTTDYSLMLRNYAPLTDVLVSRVRARPLVDQEPTISLGPEQSAP
jgi:hypothetical protein